MPFTFNNDPLHYVCGRDNFAFDRWQDRWALPTNFRILNLSAALQPLNLQRGDIEPLKSRFPIVAGKIPPAWKTLVPDASAWVNLGRPQILGLAGRRCQTFGRALHSLVYVVDYLENVRGLTLPQTFLDPVTIMPIIFHLTFQAGVERKDVWAKIEGTPLEDELRTLIQPSDPSIVREAVLDGKRMSYWTAETIFNRLRAASFAVELVCSANRTPGTVSGEVFTQASTIAPPKVVPNHIREL